jgi:hypothetical protein
MQAPKHNHPQAWIVNKMCIVKLKYALLKTEFFFSAQDSSQSPKATAEEEADQTTTTHTDDDENEPAKKLKLENGTGNVVTD